MVVSLFLNLLKVISLVMFGGPEPPVPARGDNPPQLPIDSTLWILLLLGLILGVYLAIRKIKPSNNPS